MFKIALIVTSPKQLDKYVLLTVQLTINTVWTIYAELDAQAYIILILRHSCVLNNVHSHTFLSRMYANKIALWVMLTQSQKNAS